MRARANNTIDVEPVEPFERATIPGHGGGPSAGIGAIADPWAESCGSRESVTSARASGSVHVSAIG